MCLSHRRTSTKYCNRQTREELSFIRRTWCAYSLSDGCAASAAGRLRSRGAACFALCVRLTPAKICVARLRSIAPHPAPFYISSVACRARTQTGTIMQATMIYIGIGIGVNAVSYFIPACKKDQS